MDFEPWYPWFKTLHIFFAIVAVGLNISYGIWQARAARESEHMGFALRGIKFLDDRVANPSYAGLLVVGIILVLTGPFEFTTLWVAVAIGLYILMGVIAIVFYSPTLKRQIAAYEAAGAQSAEFQALGAARTGDRHRPGGHRDRDPHPHGGQAVLHEPLTPSMDDLPVPGRQRSWWLREALAAEGDPPPSPPLAMDTDADVVIVGGGYTGMWAAYFIHERWPDARVVLLEQDICGGGPSGRNGGFVHGWWESLDYLIERFGPDAGMEIAREADEVVDGIGAWCKKHRVDAHYVKAGYLRVNAFPNEPPDWDEAVERLRAAGVGDQLEPVDLDAVQRICASPAFREGLLMPSAASIQPALLARGLRRVLLKRGVRDLRRHARRIGLA